MAQQEIHRNPNGTFGKGTVANPAGRPKREVEAEYLDTTIASVSPEDWAAVVKSMLTFAKAGNVPAARWLADYILGKPVEQVNITGEETADVILRLPTIQPSANGNGADGSDDGNAD